MSRFLFVVPPLTGHTNPTVAVGAALAQRGHEVAWTGHAKVIGQLLAPGAHLIPVGEDPDEDDPALADAKKRSQGLRGAEALLFLWEEFLLPLARSMVPGVEAAVDRFRPDVLVVDQQAIAGAAVAQRRGLRWATSATTSAELVDPFALLPKVGEWVREALAEFQASYGVAGGVDLRFSDQLVLAFTTVALAGPGPEARPGAGAVPAAAGVPRAAREAAQGGYPSQYRFVGPSIGARPPAIGFPWEWLDRQRQLVLVSLGTINAEAGRRFLGEAMLALGQMADRLQAVVVGPEDMVADAPANVLVRSRVPQLDLLAHVDAVMSHGGHNTVCESLAQGIPLVVAPIRDDQPIVAQQVVDAGAGVRVRFGRARAADLKAAVTEVLDASRYQEAAGRIRDSFAAAGGAAASAEALEELAQKESA